MGRHSAPSKVKPRAIMTGALVSSAAIVTGSLFIPQQEEREWSPVESSTPVGLPAVNKQSTTVVPENDSAQEAVRNALVSVRTRPEPTRNPPATSSTPERTVQRELRNAETLQIVRPSPTPRPRPVISQELAQPRAVSTRVIQVRAEGSTPAPQPKAAKPTTKAVTNGTSANRIASNARVLANMDIQYVFGGKSVRSGLDCSAFVWEALKRSGYKVPYRNSSALRAWTERIPRSQARAGDLVFWPGHVGVYLGNGMVADAGSPKTDTSIRKVWGSPTYGRIPPK